MEFGEAFVLEAVIRLASFLEEFGFVGLLRWREHGKYERKGGGGEEPKKESLPEECFWHIRLQSVRHDGLVRVQR